MGRIPSFRCTAPMASVTPRGVSDGLPVHDATGLRVPEPTLERLLGVEDADLCGGGPVPRDPLYEVPERLLALPQPPIHHGGTSTRPARAAGKGVPGGAPRRSPARTAARITAVKRIRCYSSLSSGNRPCSWRDQSSPLSSTISNTPPVTGFPGCRTGYSSIFSGWPISLFGSAPGFGVNLFTHGPA